MRASSFAVAPLVVASGCIAEHVFPVALSVHGIHRPAGSATVEFGLVVEVSAANVVKLTN